jgi:hypothetical protein
MVCYGFVNVHEQTEDRSGDKKDKYYEELDRVFNHFQKHHVKIFVGDFNAILGREGTVELITENENLLEIINDNVDNKHIHVRRSIKQCSHIATFINMAGLFLMEKHTT